MWTVYLKPLKFVVGIVMLGGLGVAANVAQLTSINILPYIYKTAPYSYIIVGIALVALYLILVVVEFHRYTRKSSRSSANHKLSGEGYTVQKNKSRLKAMVGATEDIFDTVERTHEIFRQVHQSGGTVTDEQESKYQRCKKQYLEKIDLIEEQFSNFIINKEYKISGSMYKNPYEWDNKPLKPVYDYASLQTAYRQMGASRSIILPDHRIQVIDQKFERIKALLTRFKNQLTNDIA